MVDAVSIVSVQSTALRLGSQGSVASAAVPAPEPVPDEGFVSSHIRVDNLQNVAILEYVSSRTGEVVRQYPSQAQINAFKRAESLQSEQPAATVDVIEPAESAPAAPAPQVVQAAPVPAAPPPVAAAPSEGSTSVLV